MDWRLLTSMMQLDALRNQMSNPVWRTSYGPSSAGIHSPRLTNSNMIPRLSAYPGIFQMMSSTPSQDSTISCGFQPKPHANSTASFSPAAAQLLYSLSEAEQKTAVHISPALPPILPVKKSGKWCAAHAKIAWEIHVNQQCQPPQPGSHGSEESKSGGDSRRLPGSWLSQSLIPLGGQRSMNDASIGRSNMQGYFGEPSFASHLEAIYKFGMPLPYSTPTSFRFGGMSSGGLFGEKEGGGSFNPFSANAMDASPSSEYVRLLALRAAAASHTSHTFTNNQPGRHTPSDSDENFRGPTKPIEIKPDDDESDATKSNSSKRSRNQHRKNRSPRPNSRGSCTSIESSTIAGSPSGVQSKPHLSNPQTPLRCRPRTPVNQLRPDSTVRLESLRQPDTATSPVMSSVSKASSTSATQIQSQPEFEQYSCVGSEQNYDVIEPTGSGRTREDEREILPRDHLTSSRSNTAHPKSSDDDTFYSNVDSETADPRQQANIMEPGNLLEILTPGKVDLRIRRDDELRERPMKRKRKDRGQDWTDSKRNSKIPPPGMIPGSIGGSGFCGMADDSPSSTVEVSDSDGKTGYPILHPGNEQAPSDTVGGSSRSATPDSSCLRDLPIKTATTACLEEPSIIDRYSGVISNFEPHA